MIKWVESDVFFLFSNPNIIKVNQV